MDGDGDDDGDDWWMVGCWIIFDSNRFDSCIIMIFNHVRVGLGWAWLRERFTYFRMYLFSKKLAFGLNRLQHNKSFFAGLDCETKTVLCRYPGYLLLGVTASTIVALDSEKPSGCVANS